VNRRVVVIGSGAAGVAAALGARSAGADVTLVRGGPGASSLTSGALDGSVPNNPVLARAIPSVLDALGIYTLGTCKLATSAGIVRVAAGRDRALCDLGASTGPVLIARVNHPAWDADALALGYAECDTTRPYVAQDVALVMHTAERAMTHADIAALHDDEARLARTAERVRAGLTDTFGAVLLPPWLGVSAPRAEALSKLVGVSCGEVLVGVGGPAGLRFEHARDAALEAAHVEIVDGRAARVTSSSVTLDGDPKGTLTCEAVVLATGGLVGGGIAYTPGHERSFALTYKAPATLGHDGKVLVVASSVHGIPPEAVSWPYADTPALERVGILSANAGLYAVGDALADGPRTMLGAFESGARAGREAARG
jgi:glycerol-3-phosphate dehydrogenase subunit B